MDLAKSDTNGSLSSAVPSTLPPPMPCAFRLGGWRRNVRRGRERGAQDERGSRYHPRHSQGDGNSRFKTRMLDLVVLGLTGLDREEEGTPSPKQDGAVGTKWNCRGFSSSRAVPANKRYDFSKTEPVLRTTWDSRQARAPRQVSTRKKLGSRVPRLPQITFPFSKNSFVSVLSYTRA